MQIPIICRNGQAKPWNSIPIINPAHPLARGLATYCYDAGGVIIDLVNGGGVLTPVAVKGGRSSKIGGGLHFGSSGWGYLGALPINKVSVMGGAAPYSAAMGTFFDSLVSGGAPDSAVVTVQSVSNNTDTFFGFNSWPSTDPTTPNAISCVFNNASNGFFTGQVVVPNTFQSWALAVTSATSAQLYSNGNAENTYSSATTFTDGTAPQIMYNTASFSPPTPGTGIPGFVPYFAMWGRVLAPWEFALLHNNPYCFLIYPEDEMFAMLVNAAVTPPGPGPNFLTSLMPMMGVG